MTDGECLVWTASSALALKCLGDAVAAVSAATHAIIELRAAAAQGAPDGGYAISQIDARDFVVDEIVTAL